VPGIRLPGRVGFFYGAAGEKVRASWDVRDRMALNGKTPAGNAGGCHCDRLSGSPGFGGGVVRLRCA